jgi:hypothetical protein
MVLHKEQERIYRELMKKVSTTRPPASPGLPHHENGEPGSLHGDVRALITRAIELEQLNSVLVAERVHAELAEQEVRSLLKERDRTVQELQQQLHDIARKEEEQEQRTLHLADDLAAEQSLRAEAEQQLEALQQEMADREAGLVAEKERAGAQLDALQQKFDALAASFEAERQKSESLGSEIQGLNAALSQKNARDEDLQALRSANATLRGELDAQKKALDLILSGQEAEKSSRKDLGEDLAAAVLGLAESEKQASAISRGREQPREEPGNKGGGQRSPGSQAPIHRDQGESDSAMRLLKEEERICRETGNRDGLQRSLGNQALIYRDRGDLDRAMKLHKEEERICRETGNRDGLQRSLGNQAVIHRDRGEFDRAMKLHKEKERICREIGNKKGIVISLVNQAGIFVYERKDPEAALPLLEEAYQIAVSSGFEGLVRQLKMHREKVRNMNSKRSR